MEGTIDKHRIQSRKEDLVGFYESQARLFKALMHPARLAILDVLRDGEQCVCHIEAALGYRQAYISQQLSVLREVGLLLDRRDGWNIFYQVSKPEIFTIIDQAAEVMEIEPRLERPDRSSSICPCPRCISTG
jgi:DNA-binding transcriptional ArsR family regulator